MLRRFAFTVCLIVPLAVHAQDGDQQIAACHQLSTADMSDCFDKLMKSWDGWLNVAYQKTLETVDPSGVPQLRAAERAWLDYRKNRCGYLAAGTGTIGAVVGGDCMVRMSNTLWNTVPRSDL